MLRGFMQAPEQEKPPVGIVFDSDMANSIDDALALALLCGFDSKHEARIVSVSLSQSSLKAAAFCEALARFYAAAAGRTVERIRPIGLSVDGKISEDTPLLTVPLSKLNAQGARVYEHRIRKSNDTADAVALIRNAFTAQHDQNCIVVLAGPATNLSRVLDLPGVKDRAKAERQVGDHLLHGRELIAWLEHPEAQSVLDLLDDLDVGRDPRAALDPERDHIHPPISLIF